MKNVSIIKIHTLLFCLCMSAANNASAQSNEKSSSWKSTIKTHASIAIDTNVYIQDAGPNAEESSLVWKAGLDFKTAYTSENAKVALSFAPTLIEYADTDDQSHQTYIFSASGKAGTPDSGLIKGKANFHVIDGNELGPSFPGTGATFLGGVGRRNRHDAYIAKLSLAYTRAFSETLHGTVRYNGYFHDFQTRSFESSDPNKPTGYVNYSDRSNQTLGLEVGWQALGEASVRAAYEFGWQDQDEKLGSSLEYDNTYHRLLIGVSGKVNETFSADFLVGPEFRSFDGTSATGFDEDRTLLYAAGSVSAKLGKKGKLTAIVSRYAQPSYTGGSVYEDYKWTFKYAQAFDDGLDTTLAFVRYEGDWLSGQGISRNDILYSGIATLQKGFANGLKVKGLVQYDTSESVVAIQEYDRTYAEVSVHKTW